MAKISFEIRFLRARQGAPGARVPTDFKPEFPMRKALLPMLASLALCGAATIALVATNARADQTGRKPVMIALVTPNDLPRPVMAAPPAEDGQPSAMRDGALRENMTARRERMCRDMY